ncbi:BMP family lipoprotein [Rhizohabitans arisaemae]|uniref:BMP family lipoprotein n=1 Tax=Rhizohabitans arisaemae TaxID=2720610 RepID=UPI0024B1CA49|nr:BMP family ABC transporter substrate-binding protein [Rhizohabitans arisaemae]
MTYPIRRRYRRRTAILLFSLFTLSACGGGESGNGTAGNGGSTAGGPHLWSLVTDANGLGDQGFNDLGKQGVEESAESLGGKASVIQSGSQSQFVPNLQQAVASGSTTVTAVGFALADAVTQVAKAHPNSRFILVDAVAVDAAGKSLPNVAGIRFREHEAAFLAGIIAGKTTKTNKLGFVGGVELPSVVRFLTGFQAGVKQANPSASVRTAYLGNFNDSAKGKGLATAHFDAGADIVFEVAGGGGLGVYDAAKTRGPGVWVVGTDTCKQRLAPDNYLTAATKDVPGAVLRQNQAAADGKFTGGEISLGLAEKAVGVCEETFAGLPAEVKDLVEKAKEAVGSGKITVPSTPDELSRFTPTAP